MQYRCALVALLALVGCGGGGDSSSHLAAAPEIVLARPGQIEILTGKPGPVTLRFGLLFENYFRCVRDGHAGVMLRADLARIPSGYYRGVGLAFGRFGNTTFTTRLLPHLEPIAVLETWTGIDGYDSILSQSVSTGLRDGVVYPVTVTSTPPNRIRYTFGDFDSGDVIDANPVVDMSEASAAFYDASGPASCPYAIRIINPSVS